MIPAASLLSYYPPFYFFPIVSFPFKSAVCFTLPLFAIYHVSFEKGYFL